MKIVLISIKAFIALLLVTPVAQSQNLSPEDVQDLNNKTGVGCIAKDPASKNADYYVVCTSRKSADQAWNAALYRSKIACSADKFSVLFNVPPTLPKENDLYGAQVEVSCSKKP